MGKLKLGDEEVEQEIYVARKLRRPLLGALEFPALFTELGRLEEEYKIQLREDAQPFALSTPCRDAIPLMPKV